MPITDTLISMKEFILAPLLNPRLFNRWLNNSIYGHEVRKFSSELSQLFDDLDDADIKRAQFAEYVSILNKSKGKKAKRAPLVPAVVKSRKEIWIDCLLGEEVTNDFRIQGFVHDDINAIRRFLANRANAPIQEYLENNLYKLSKAAESCERYMCTLIDFRLPLSDAVREIAKAKELLIEYPKVREKLKDEMIESSARKETKGLSEQTKNTFILNLCVPDTRLHRNTSQLLLSARRANYVTPAEAFNDFNKTIPIQGLTDSKLLLRVPNVRLNNRAAPPITFPENKNSALPPLSSKVQNDLRAAHKARDSKRDAFPISCTHRMAKILARQLYEKIEPHLDQLFDIYQFLSTCKYVEHSKTLNIFYIYMLVLLAKNKNYYYLSKICIMLDRSLRQLIDEHQLVSVANIIPFFITNSRVKTYWQTIHETIAKLNVALKPKILTDVEDKIYLLLNPAAKLTKADKSILNGSGSAEILTPSPPLDDDTFHVRGNNNDIDLLQNMDEEAARFMTRSQRANSANAIARKRNGMFLDAASKLPRLDTAPIASKSRIAANKGDGSAAEDALLPPPPPSSCI